MRLSLPLIFLLLTACSSMPSVIREMDVMSISYSRVNQETENYKNAPVRWGGTIVDVENEEEFSLMQVLFYPLDYYGQPQLDKPEGRFVIKSNEFLDPAIYASDREITVVGLIDGKIERTVGNKKISVPLITSTALYLWPVRYHNNPSNYYGYPGYPGYYRGYPSLFGLW